MKTAQNFVKLSAPSLWVEYSLCKYFLIYGLHESWTLKGKLENPWWSQRTKYCKPIIFDPLLDCLLHTSGLLYLKQRLVTLKLPTLHRDLHQRSKLPCMYVKWLKYYVLLDASVNTGSIDQINMVPSDDLVNLYSSDDMK